MIASKKIDISNSLRSFLNTRHLRNSIEEFFKKKTHSSETKNFRPESDAWLKAKQEDEKINNLPDHNVTIKYDDLIIEHNYKEIKFTIGTITTIESSHWSEDGDYENREVTRNFIVENSYWGHGLICSFDELLNHNQVQELFEKMLDDQRKEKWRNRLETIGDGVFILLLDKIVKLEKDLIYTEIYRSDKDGLFIEIGEEKYYAKDMVEINQVYKTGDYAFYDEWDRKIEYSDYLYGSFPDFYIKHSKK